MKDDAVLGPCFNVKRDQGSILLDGKEVLSIKKLYDVRHKKLDEYSGGMKQRILFAQAMIGNADIVILDDPTAGLDIEDVASKILIFHLYPLQVYLIWNFCCTMV